MTELHEYVKRKSAEREELDRKARSLRSFNHRQKALISHALKNRNIGVTVYSHQGAHNVSYATARSDLFALSNEGLLIAEKTEKPRAFYPAPNLENQLNK